MRPLSILARCLSVIGTIFATFAHAQDNAVYLATYVEVAPTAAAAGATLLKRYHEGSRKEGGNLRFDVLQESARPNRFVILEAWQDKPALDAHANAVGTAQFTDKLKDIAAAPSDQRVTRALYTERGKSAKNAGTVYVVTHVDVIPSGKDGAIAALKAISAEIAGDAGNVGYDVLQQFNHDNHFTVVEAWADRSALDAHAAALHTRKFRDQLAPLIGALYDERVYTALP